VNHGSYLDALVLCAALPPEAAYAFVAKREFVAQPAIYAFLRQLDTLFVERHEASRSVEDVAALVAGLTAGRKLVIFPEGTFSREAGLKPFHMGAFVSAARTGVPVLPCALRGTRSVLRDRTWLPRRGNLAVALGEPLFPEGTDWAAAVCLRDTARSAVLALCGEHDLAR
ncbi:MAG: 1-acyl-sn-glycerol-3-phosphate acyltransferase, partial [Dokdonella sp.]